MLHTQPKRKMTVVKNCSSATHEFTQITLSTSPPEGRTSPQHRTLRPDRKVPANTTNGFIFSCVVVKFVCVIVKFICVIVKFICAIIQIICVIVQLICVIIYCICVIVQINFVLLFSFFVR